MTAYSVEEAQRRKRRKRLLQGLLVGAAAIGLPAAANAIIRKRAGALAPPTWGRSQLYAWRECEVAFQRLGQGIPIVLLHSLGPGHDGTQWRGVGEILAEDFQVFVPDLPGWGRSEKPSIAYDGELYIQLLDDFLADVVGRRAVVVAAGLPAAYAVQLAVDTPERFRCLGLVGPQGLEIHGDEPDLKDAVVHRLLRLPVFGTSALNVYTSRSGIENHLRNEVLGAPEYVDADLVDHHYVAAHQPGAHAALAAYLAGYLNHSVEELLPRLDVPTWLAWGGKASSPPLAASEQWLRQGPVELQVFHRCGNLPHLEVPTAFTTALLEFMSKLSE